MTGTIDRSATRVSTAIAVGAAFVATASAALVSPAALLTAIPGVIGVMAGLHLTSRRVLSGGVVGLLLGSLIAGTAGASALTVLVSVTAGVLTWDYATTAIGVGEQLGRAAETDRIEGVHALASAGVGVGTIALSYGIYRSIAGTYPVAAVFFLLVASILLAWSLR